MDELLTDEQAFGTPTTSGQTDGLMSDQEAWTPAPVKLAKKVQDTDGLIDTFAGSFQEATGGYQDLGFSKETQKMLGNDWEKGENDLIGSFNDMVTIPAAAALDAGMRTAMAGIFSAPGATMKAYAEQMSGDTLMKPIASVIGMTGEYLENVPQGGGLGLHETAPSTFTKNDLAKARAVGAVGEDEATYMGLKDPTPEQYKARIAANNNIVEPPTIHEVARQLAPDTFEAYDKLSATKDALREQINDLSDERTKALDDQIQELQDAKKGGHGKIQALMNKREAILEQGDTPEMADLRKQLMESDQQMRDLAPDVSEAYRNAEDQMPKTPEPAPVEEATKQDSTDQPEPAKPIEQQVASIAADVSQKLVDAGRPAEEAQAASQLVAEHYRAISEQGWAKGTAEEIYQRDSANIEAGKQKDGTAPQELNQKNQGKIRPATDFVKATIKLFSRANASTFIHETGHHWLDEMMRYAGAGDAPESLSKSAESVRDWLGVKEGEAITRRQHEKFARGFERYMMEGTAPSPALAGVFAKFKQWLTSIYQTVDRLRSPITPDIRDVFDRLLSSDTERTVIAPEAESFMEEPARETPKTGETLPTEVRDGVVGPTTQIDSMGKATAEPSREVASQSSDKTNLPQGANERFANQESRLIDKAGNIRLDNLNTADDVNAVIKDIAEQNGSFLEARRGSLSDGEVLDLADALGMSPESLNARKLGQAFNAEQIIAARRLLIQSATNLRDIMKKAASGAESDILAYIEAKGRHQMIQEQVSGLTAEAGRALRAFRNIEGADKAKALEEFLKTTEAEAIKPEEYFQKMAEEAQRGASLDTPQKVSRFVNDSKKQGFRSKIIEYYINALISGPVTHMRYAVGNAINAIVTPLIEIPAASGIGFAKELITGEKSPDRVYLGESLAQIHALAKGSRDGLVAAIDAFKTGVSPALPTERVSAQFALDREFGKSYAIGGKVGEVLNIPSRSVSAIHSFFKSLRYEQNIQGLAFREAMKAGLEGDEFTNKVSDLSSNPTEAMMQEATSGALRELYMSPTEYNSNMWMLTRFFNNNLVAKIMVPFMKIGSQITRNAFIDRSPLGLLSKDVRGTILEGTAKSDVAIAKMAIGTALMGTTVLLAAEGKATGDGPNDPKQRAIWLMNHRPNSIQIGNITVPYQGLGSLGMLMRFSANMYETAHAWDGEDGFKLASGFMEGITKSVLDENFMRGLKDGLDAAYHHEEYGDQYLRSMVTNWMPFSVGLSQIDRKTDPYQREVNKHQNEIQQIFDTARSKIPMVSEGLFPRRDRFGQPIPNDGMTAQYLNDPVVQRMLDLHIGVGKLEDKINGVRLTGQQYDDYSKISGNLMKMRLDGLVKTQGFADEDPYLQIKMIDKIIGDSRARARNIILMQNPDLIRQATQNKINAARGVKP